MNKYCERVGCLNKCIERFCSVFCRKSFSSQIAASKRKAKTDAARRAKLEELQIAHKQSAMEILKLKLNTSKKRCQICKIFIKSGQDARVNTNYCKKCSKISCAATIKANEEREKMRRKIRATVNKKHKTFYDGVFWHDRIEEIFDQYN